MKFSRNKKMATTLALSLLLTISAILVALPIVSAHTPHWTVPTYSYIAIAPNPIGVDQTIYLVVWTHPNPPTAAGLAGDRWRDMTVEVTKPNGDTQTLGPWNSDPTGSTFTTYTPDQIGEYTFVYNYPGQVLTAENPDTGLVPPPGAFYGFGGEQYVGDTALASSATATLTVQEDPIEKLPPYPFPEEYWTRPIEGQNSEWANIASNWLYGAQLGSFNLWQKDGTAPKTSHIMWTKPIETGGIVGGTTRIPEVGFYSGGSYEGRFSYGIIMNGKLYFEMPLGHSASGGGYMCMDLRTGEEVWYREDLGGITKAQLFEYESQNQHGVVGSTLWKVSGNKWIAYDGFTGKWAYNLTNVPNGYEAYTTKGEIVRYVLNAENNWLALWNNTQDDMGLHGGYGSTTDAYQWRPNGKEVDMSEAYTWNVTIDDLPGLGSPLILGVIPGDIILGSSTTWAGFVSVGTQDPYTLWAISDKEEDRGTLLWLNDYAAPAGNITRAPGPNTEIEVMMNRAMGLQTIDPVNRVFLLSDEETFQYLGYDLDTGDLLWGPSGAPDFRAYQYYGGGLGGGQIGMPAYGNLYVASYGGEVHCYDTSDGTLLWQWNDTNSGLETIWGLYPTAIGAIADGKVYVFNNEHSPNYPLYKGYSVYCLDANTGEELWRILSWAGHTGGPGTSTMIEAEGFVVYYNYYDNQLYCIGKGPSKTTVTGPEAVQPLGTEVLIQGSVLDTAGGTNQDAVATRFPHGIPAVSDQSMSKWMEYLYMQKPCPMDVQGVEVTLDIIKPDGSFDRIGTARSDGYGLFAKLWTPDEEGEYTIIATFEGSDSYWPSYAETIIGVGPAPSAAEEVSPEAEAGAGLTTAQIAIIVAVVVVAVAGIAAYWILRKLR